MFKQKSLSNIDDSQLYIKSILFYFYIILYY